MEYLALLVGLFCGALLWDDAEKKGRNKIYAGMMGFFLGIFGLALYLCFRTQKWMQDPQATTKKTVKRHKAKTKKLKNK